MQAAGNGIDDAFFHHRGDEEDHRFDHLDDKEDRNRQFNLFYLDDQEKGSFTDRLSGEEVGGIVTGILAIAFTNRSCFAVGVSRI